MAEVLWTSDQVLMATGGVLGGGAFEAGGVSIDTRSLEPGDLFVALEGVRDGHEFVPAALAAGGAASLVSRPVEGPHVVVPDTLKALEKLGLAARERSGALRCAVTGSVGKTSVTQAIAAGLRLAGPAHSSIKSYNNQIGVPLTLARMPASTERAVFEVGMNHAGEITPLSHQVQPDVAVITTVGPVHTENFPDGEAGIARAKAEIFAGLKPGGTAILNADNQWFEFLSAAAEKAGAKVLSFGSGEGCAARLIKFSPPHISAMINGERIEFDIRQSGDHWGLTSLAVMLSLTTMDVPIDLAIRAMSNFDPLDGRGAVRNVGGIVLIDESYNANPLSMASAIRTLGAYQPAKRRIAVLTDMLELGPDGPRLHAELAAILESAQIDKVFCAGPLMKNLFNALSSTRRGGYAEDAAHLTPDVLAAVSPGDVVMVKGSNGSKAHAIAGALANPGDGEGRD